jgi:hypothetical protein
MRGGLMGSGEPLELVHQALRRSDYGRAITVASSISTHELSPEEISHLMDLLLASAAGLADNSPLELQAYILVIEMGDLLSSQDSA